MKHACTIPNLAIAWALERPAVAAVVVGARDDSHVLENLRALGVSLDREDHALIERLQAEAEGPAGDCYYRERLYATGGGEE